MIRRIMSLLFVAVLVASQLCDVAKAAYDEGFYAGNDILFYDPRCDSGVAVGSITLAGKDNLEKVLNFLMRKGLTLAQASGAVGNLMAESGLNPAIIQGGRIAPDDYTPVNGVGFGLAQWTFTGRQQPLVNLARESGAPVTNLGVQLNYLWQELSGPYANNTLTPLKATNDPVQAAVIFHNGYEGSADSSGAVITNRGGNAARVYETYADAPALAGSAADDELNYPAGMPDKSDHAAEISSGTFSGSCSSGTFQTGNLAQTVTAYAWPQYAVRTDQMPAYAEAVVKAKSENLYIGGNSGNDCGAFVTLLLRNSGFEPHYNTDGRGGNTILQEMWLSKNWRKLTPAEVADASQRQPGDVAINYQHTYVYVGQIGGFGSKIASASLGGPQRAPMAGHEGATDSSFRWYRRQDISKASSNTTAVLQDTASGGGGGSW